jgi:hypothetical protein
MSSTPFTPSGDDEHTVAADGLEDIEETWTFVDDDTDPDVSKKGQQIDHDNSGSQIRDTFKGHPAETPS